METVSQENIDKQKDESKDGFDWWEVRGMKNLIKNMMSWWSEKKQDELDLL